MAKTETYTLFDLIDSFMKPKKGTLVKKKSPLDNLEASIKPLGKNFSVTFNLDRGTKGGKNLDVGQHHKKVKFQFGEQSYVLSDLFLGRRSPPQFTGQKSFLYTKGYSLKKKLYYRLVILLGKQLNHH